MLDFFGAPEYSVPPLPCDDAPKQPEQPINSPNILAYALSNTVGSSLVELGNTRVMAVVKGPHTLPKSQQNASKGILRISILPTAVCFESMTPEAIQKMDKYTSLLHEELRICFESTILLERHARMSIDLFVYILNDDGNVFTAATIASSAALAEAQVHMLDVLIGFTIAKIDLDLVVEPTKSQECSGIVIYLTYAPSLEKIASVRGLGSFKDDEILGLKSVIKTKSEVIFKQFKRSLLLAMQKNTNLTAK